MTENDKAKRHLEIKDIYHPDELLLTNTQMLISIANSLKDIVDVLNKINDRPFFEG